MNCIDCGAHIEQNTNGRPPSRCADCRDRRRREYSRKYTREYYRKKRGSQPRKESKDYSCEIWAYLQEHAPCTPLEIGRAVYGYGRDAGQIAVKLEQAGYLVYLDEQNQLYPWKEVTA